MEPERPSAGTARSIAITIAFVVVVQLVALWFTQINAPITTETGYTYAPVGTSSLGSLGNVIILVSAVFATTLLAVWLIRTRRVRVFTTIIFIGTSLALFLLTFLTALDATSDYVAPYPSLYLSIAISAGVVVVFAISSRRASLALLAPLITGLLSAEVGSYFASTIPFLTALILPAVFSIYDIYAVFRGPLRQLVSMAPEEALAGVTSRLGEFSIGTGDTIFYSLLPALALYQFGVAAALLTLGAVDIGVVVTLYLLARSKMLPGLPIPMALGLATLVAFILV